jgi:type II secretory pathway component PulC
MPASIEQPVMNMASWHLFGISTSYTELIPVTDLKLTLRGLLVSVPAKDSQVIISELGKEEKVYSVGDPLPGGAILYKILIDSVILQHNGRLEKLSPPEIEEDVKPS